MIKTAEFAEDLSKKLEKPNLCVVGWYHSHPNITVWPSHVDLRTQFNYQRLESLFIGLIFSVFNVEKVKKSHQYEVIAFQAQEDENKRNLKQLLIDLEVVPNNDKMSPHVAEEMVRLSEILCQENVEMADKMASDDAIKETSGLELPKSIEDDYAETYGDDALADLKQDFGKNIPNFKDFQKTELNTKIFYMYHNKSTTHISIL